MAVGKTGMVRLKGVKSVQLDARLAELLDRLDEEDLVTPGRGRRQSARYSYRLRESVVTLYQPGGTTQSLLVPTRNISSSGIAFLHGGFVHLQTRCTVQLITTKNTRQVVQGRVVRCKHIEGRVHEIGIRFDQEVDVAAFARSAVQWRVLVADDEASMRRLLAHYLKELNAEVTAVEGGEEVVEEALHNAFDLILLDLDMPGLDGFGVLELLRGKGYCGTIVALTAHTGEEARARCLSAGFDDHWEKPISKEVLAELLGSVASDPLYSSLAGGREVEQLVSAFVEELATKTRVIEEVLANRDVAEVRRLARALRGDAGSYGFEPIAEVAREVEEVSVAGESLEVLAATVRRLVVLCQTARGPTCKGGVVS